MDDLGAVIDAPEIDAGIEEVDEGIAQVEEGTEPVEPVDPAAKDASDPYTTKFSREMRAALKSWEASNPEAARFAKQARDNHARLFALTQLEPKGIDGVRERYALLEGLQHGEAKGPEALAAMQDEYQSYKESDEYLASGDPRALEALDDSFNGGLAKLAPAYLDRVSRTDPAAFEAAVLPHFTKILASSDLVKEYNALIDVLNSQGDPRFDDKTKMSFAIQQLSKMGQWLNGISDKAVHIKSAPRVDDQRTQFEQERTEFEKQKQEAHWERSIYPEAGKLVETKFNELLAPYQKRLQLTQKQKDAAFSDFKTKNAALCSADKDYDNQIKRYRSQKNPDSRSVLNSVKVQLNKTARDSFEQVKSERWEAFLAGKPQPKPNVQAANGKPQPPVAANVEIRTVKPPMNEIDHRNTPVEWMSQKKYRLFSGKVVQVRTA